MRSGGGLIWQLIAKALALPAASSFTGLRNAYINFSNTGNAGQFTKQMLQRAAPYLTRAEDLYPSLAKIRQNLPAAAALPVLPQIRTPAAPPVSRYQGRTTKYTPKPKGGVSRKR